NRGMIGIGVVFHAILERLVTDDSELALAMCPFTYRPLSVPLVNVRALLYAARAAGITEAAATIAFNTAAAIHFLDRRSTNLARVWCDALPEEAPLLLSFLEDPATDVKAADALHAVDYALAIGDGTISSFAPVPPTGTLPLWKGIHR